MKLNSQKVKSLLFLSLLNSVAGKKAKPKQQTGTSSPNSLPKLATNLTAGKNNSDPTLFFAGMPIFFENRTVDWEICKSSFPIVCQDHNCDSRWELGFITSAFCCKDDGLCLAYEVFNAGDSQLLGQVGSIPDVGGSIPIITDHAFVATGFGEASGKFQFVPYVMGDKEFYPIVGLGSITLGSNVSACGGSNGYLYGSVVEMNLSVTSGWNVNFEGVNKVDLGENGLKGGEDLGGPVYTVSRIGEQTVAQALGHITWFDNIDPNHKFLYYTPIDKALSAMFSDPGFPGFHYSLMIYNESSAQDHKELLTQIEIPPKN